MGSFTAMNWGWFHRTAPNFGATAKSDYLSPFLRHYVNIFFFSWEGENHAD
jgi:hypothetical protein